VGDWGCGQCPHFGSRTGPYRCRIGPDWRCFRGSSGYSRAGTRFESHLGHMFSLVRGFLVFFRVHIVHTLASDLMFRVCGVPDRPVPLCGGVADYGGPGTALWGLFWELILVRPFLGFSRSPLHGGRGRVQHDLLIILSIGLVLGPVTVFRSGTCSCRNAEGTA
jgi:hypothetical protein